MSARALMSVSARGFLVLGLPLLFFPQELAATGGLDATAALPLQLFAGGVLAMASLNWAGRGAIYGGIYGRPIALANFGFGLITAGSLTSALLDGALPQWGWVLAGAFALHAVAFWRVMQGGLLGTSEIVSPGDET